MVSGLDPTRVAIQWTPSEFLEKNKTKQINFPRPEKHHLVHEGYNLLNDPLPDSTTSLKMSCPYLILHCLWGWGL